MLYVRFWDFDLSKAVTAFFSFDVVDWQASDDGKSADAGAIYSTYMEALIRVLGPGAGALLKAGLISISFDGASVMLGSTNPVAALFYRVRSSGFCVPRRCPSP